jgi:hypothetical protein
MTPTDGLVRRMTRVVSELAIVGSSVGSGRGFDSPESLQNPIAMFFNPALHPMDVKAEA